MIVLIFTKSAHMIENIVEASNLDNLLRLSNVCIFMFHYGLELMRIFVSNMGTSISFYSGYVANIDGSKTDQLKKGNEGRKDSCYVMISRQSFPLLMQSLCS